MDTSTIRKLLNRAIKGELLADKLYSGWDETWNSNHFLKEVFDNLEDSVEHIPGYFFKEGVNIKKWQQSSNYMILKIDLVLIEYLDSKSDLQILKIRDEKIRQCSP